MSTLAQAELFFGWHLMSDVEPVGEWAEPFVKEFENSGWVDGELPDNPNLPSLFDEHIGLAIGGDIARNSIGCVFMIAKQSLIESTMDAVAVTPESMVGRATWIARLHNAARKAGMNPREMPVPSWWLTSVYG